RDVRDVGLCGASDASILGYAVAHGLTLVTGDVGFSNVLNFPIERHHGIIVVRFPNEISAMKLVEDVAQQLVEVGPVLSRLGSSRVLIMLEPGRWGMRVGRPYR